MILRLNSGYFQQYFFQQMHNLIFIYDKLGLHVSAYQATIRAPITDVLIGRVYRKWNSSRAFVGKNIVES
jgi:hypothetical protein